MDMEVVHAFFNMGFFPVLGCFIAMIIGSGGCGLGAWIMAYEVKESFDKEDDVDNAGFIAGLLILLIVGVLIPTAIITSILICNL